MTHLVKSVLLPEAICRRDDGSEVAEWPAGQLFAEKMLPQTARGRICFPRVGQIPEHGFLCYRNKQTYFSLAKMCWLNDSYFD